MPSATNAPRLASRPRCVESDVSNNRRYTLYTRRRADHRSRMQRWRDVVTELLALQGAYAAWLEALPDTLQGMATADTLQAIADLDLTTLALINLPNGYGRD